MKSLNILLFSALISAVFHGAVAAAQEEACLVCHQQTKGFSRFHDPGLIGCAACHNGDVSADTEQGGHRGMEAFPGRMSTLKQTCGRSGCHEEQVRIVEHSVMNTLDGMIESTRRVFGAPSGNDNDPILLAERLSGSGADSYLRKLCVSCHLGKDRKNHSLGLRDRGGGCAACHLQNPPVENPDLHPRLSVRVHSDRCFGCHSRSGRISLNYYGLAEVERVDQERIGDFGRLPDKRLVEKKTMDVHARAGMDCVDCHTVRGVMGSGKRGERQLDIQCVDCHGAVLPVRALRKPSSRESLYPALYAGQYFYTEDGKVAATSRHGTPLFHLREKTGPETALGRDPGVLRTLTGKVNHKEFRVPLIKQGPHHDQAGHQRLTCDSCHSAWAPQCYGCHIRFDPNRKQWDHLKNRKTAGRWIESRWGVEAEPPGMNLILEPPGGGPPIRRRLYAALSPHTTVRAGRTCESCHLSDEALGIIKSSITHPEHPEWSLPKGWIREDSQKPGNASNPDARSLNTAEIRRVRRVGECLRCHPPADPVYRDFQQWRSALSADHPPMN